MKYKITISGMHCASCAGNVERSVRGVKGVHGVRVSAVTNTAFIEAEDSTNVKEIENAIAKPGYKAVAIQKSP